ncbi:STT3 domain-containing protein [Desulfurobacterium atlanticum]|uniref:Dolichyl-diphosphooligosaccharide--protein glycosyltransferase n=1 Tax=Desulfurobacterium atlanticum TaxID=240169 RepID=A0A238XRN4_9BACT|nr:STT3 domain-containing protein [Desulfurobacterium atlanticum]SNR61103.1 dolichyl-diphosphooligosaccharide--protein glycosyltransferase [Desulfurobacterium atlanticum]
MNKLTGVKLLRTVFLILIPIVMGLFIRFDDLSIWNKNKNRFYYNDRPLFTSYDAFYFARWGLDYMEGKYKAGEMDPLRFVPDNYIREKLTKEEREKLKAGRVTYPSPIPMESFLGAVFAKFGHTYIENVALWLTPVLAVLFVIPLILYFSEIGAPVAGFSGAIFGVTALMYLARTTIVRFDTDSLNLFFPFMVAYLFYKTISEKEIKKKYIFAALSGIFMWMFNWWYAHPDLVLIMFIVFVAGVFINYRKFDKENLKLIGVVALFSNPLILFHGLKVFWGRFSAYVINFTNPATQTGFPNIFQSISEAQRASLKLIAATTTGNIILFWIGFILIFVLFARKGKKLLFLIPIFLLGLMVFKSGNRFAMYLAPFVGAGIGYLFDIGMEYYGKLQNKEMKTFKETGTIFSAVIISLIVFISQSQAFKFVATPKITPALERDFIKLKKITPENAWIWTWWDYGTAIQYLGRRAVYHDGQSQFSPKTYFVATTFSNNSPEKAYNTIVGISSVGITFLDKWIKEDGLTPEKIRENFFNGKYNKPITHPVYWIFTEDEIGKFTWINYFGTWDFKLKRGIKKRIIPVGVCEIASRRINCSGGISVDTEKGILKANRLIPLNSIAVRTKNKLKEKIYNVESNLHFETVTTSNGNFLGFIMDDQPYYSMFNQMYILRKFDPKFFELTYDNFPTMVVYKVKEAKQK